MQLSVTQKERLIKYYPELSGWLKTRENKTEDSALDQLVFALISKIESVKGEKGDPGHTPVKGKDYWTDGELNTVIKYILREATPIKGRHYVDGKDGKTPTGKELTRLIIPLIPDAKEGKDGKDGSPDTPHDIVSKINTLTGVLEPSVIKGVATTKDLESRDKKVLDGMARIDGRIKLIDQRWGAHGGGKGTPFAGTSEKSTTTPNGVVTTFAFAHTPTLIFWNGQMQFVGDDYTVSGTSITFTASAGVPVANDKIINTYA